MPVDDTPARSRGSLEQLTRRDVLKLLGMGSAAAAIWPILEACGTNSGVSSGARLTADQLKPILGYAGITDTTKMGAGTTWKLGATLPYSGNGSFFSGMWSSGIDLALDHIQKLGGPNIQFNRVDNGSGDATKSKQALDQLVSAGVGGILATEAEGGVFAPMAQGHILCLDSGAGAPTVIQGVPYFYGARSAYYSDQWDGTLSYMKAKMPSKKNVVVVNNPSTFFNTDIYTVPLMKKYGFEQVKTVDATAGATDYAAVLAEIRAINPDILWMVISQYDIGYFMKQYASSGLHSTVFTFQWTRAAREIAGSGYQGVYFSTEYLDWANPQNPWQKLYVEDYKAKYGYYPEAYTADFYMNVFMWWQLLRDTMARGGDINKGDDLIAAMAANPSFPTIFGGDSSNPGIVTMDMKTHSPSTLPQAVFVDRGGDKTNPTLEKVATYNVGGGDFKLV